MTVLQIVLQRLGPKMPLKRVVHSFIDQPKFVVLLTYIIMVRMTWHSHVSHNIGNAVRVPLRGVGGRT